MQLLPMTAGMVVLAYNVPSLPTLRLSRDAYVRIFLGKITKWNDPAIADANPGHKLPDMKIHVVVRTDSSGTTYAFSKHLSAVSEDFAKSPGPDKSPNWPVGTKVKRNEGVSAAVSTTPGSIGYVEYVFATRAKLKMAALQNKAGKYVRADHCLGRGRLGHNRAAGGLDRLGSRSRGRQFVPDRRLHVDHLLQAVRRRKEGGRAEGPAGVLPDGGPESERASLGYIPFPESVTEKVTAALGNIGSDGDRVREVVSVAEARCWVGQAERAQPEWVRLYPFSFDRSRLMEQHAAHLSQKYRNRISKALPKLAVASTGAKKRAKERMFR